MECQELQARMDYGDLSADQQRFARQELDECRGRVKSAEAKDSAFVEGAERRLSPSATDGTPSETDSTPSEADSAGADPK